MRMSLNEVKLGLERRQNMSLVQAVGTRITCVSGCLWLTQHRDARDIVLAAGESFVLDRPGVAVIEAIRPSTLAIREAISSSAVPQAVAVAHVAPQTS